MPISATYQCLLISTTYQCPSVQPISAHHCSLISTHQCGRTITYLQHFITETKKKTFF
ncbi:unnamed protein product [Staurois parvus]|uniref:Uncharacterized protein n=1 Tax=Staurois parvus TaxID=386267 RepID=A0ABN9C9H2_9NEOB|nr:unnamed protein product [Staurois parvus]